MNRTRTLDPAAIRSIAFVGRCTAASILSYAAASGIGLGHPLWAVVSTLIVSQETASETQRSFLWRCAGTLLGAGVAVPAALWLMPDPARPLAAIALAVPIAAAVARRWPRLRVCLWTAPLVILTATADHSLLHTASQRCGEVLLGGLIGSGIHRVIDHLARRWLKLAWDVRDAPRPPG
ncbi:hypothetical protein ASF49_06935 [Methylobacterium sp. Leaf104]|uniref:FUSC family protein n=1 Tax=Methylobacterium TaxID=407 RepID=UPI0006F45F2A|nr:MULTISPECIES: FUSC family protein [Methylobacterium]KQP33617.1 hypothetical protein ASF49_06935 [Methylobacterium sp. Leaf104]MCI9879847.1 FUSC family protein [Methylobacterium goesingense]